MSREGSRKGSAGGSTGPGSPFLELPTRVDVLRADRLAQLQARIGAGPASQPTDLIVVDGIDYHSASGGLTTRGGRVRIWRDWTPLDDDLAARKFAYTLPHN